MHPSVISKIKRDAETYSNCAAKCSKIWAAISKNDIAGNNMTENVMEVIFK
jgi:predicted lipoprotein with Yx(FWY)xxD motif